MTKYSEGVTLTKCPQGIIKIEVTLLSITMSVNYVEILQNKIIIIYMNCSFEENELNSE